MSNAAKTPSSAYLEFAEDFRTQHPAVDAGSMFGMRCLKSNGKAFAGGFDGGLVLKLPAAEYTAASALPGAAPFDPSGKGHPMGGWLVLGVEHRDEWLRLATTALLSLPSPS